MAKPSGYPRDFLRALRKQKEQLKNENIYDRDVADFYNNFPDEFQHLSDGEDDCHNDEVAK